MVKRGRDDTDDELNKCDSSLKRVKRNGFNSKSGSIRVIQKVTCGDTLEHATTSAAGDIYSSTTSPTSVNCASDDPTTPPFDDGDDCSTATVKTSDTDSDQLAREAKRDSSAEAFQDESVTEKERDTFDAWLCADLHDLDTEWRKSAPPSPKERKLEQKTSASHTNVSLDGSRATAALISDVTQESAYPQLATGPEADLVRTFQQTLGFLEGFGLGNIGNYIIETFSLSDIEIAFCLQVVDTDPPAHPPLQVKSEPELQANSKLVEDDLAGALKNYLSGEDVLVGLGLDGVGRNTVGTFCIAGMRISYCLEIMGLIPANESDQNDYTDSTTRKVHNTAGPSDTKTTEEAQAHYLTEHRDTLETVDIEQCSRDQPSESHPKFYHSHVTRPVPALSNSSPRRGWCYQVNKPRGCKWGSACHYSHELEGVVCAYILNGEYCPNVQTCPHKHTISEDSDMQRRYVSARYDRGMGRYGGGHAGGGGENNMQTWWRRSY